MRLLVGGVDFWDMHRNDREIVRRASDLVRTENIDAERQRIYTECQKKVLGNNLVLFTFYTEHLSSELRSVF